MKINLTIHAVSNILYCYWNFEIFVTIYIHRKTVVMEVETNIITNITVSPIGLAGILLIMYVETFQTAVIIFVCNIIMHLMSVLSHLTDNFQYRSQFVNTDNITISDDRIDWLIDWLLLAPTLAVIQLFCGAKEKCPKYRLTNITFK